MRTHFTKTAPFAAHSICLAFLIGSGVLMAQDPASAPPAAPNNQAPQAQPQNPPNNGGWRRVDEGNTAAAPDQSPAPQNESETQPAPPPNDAPRATMDPNYSQGPVPQGSASQAPNAPAQPPYAQPPARRGEYRYPQANRGPVPASVTLRPGTYITVRLNQGLSSDRNHEGDGFAATLAKPVVVDGVVIADRGQTVGGRVTEATKAGRISGVSHLGVQLTDLTLLDGNPVQIQTKLFTKNGPTSQGRDAAAVAGTTATGAAIGAAADWGRGAAIGAGAGALVGIVGVLVTRGRPTYLYPEQILTFRVEAPVTISTEAAPQAFRWVGPGDYERPYDRYARTAPPNGPPYGGYYGYPYAYAYPYPYYWGPAVGFYWGPRGWWGGRWGWRR